MAELTLYDIMGEDHEIYVKMQEDNQICVLVINESGDEVFQETTHIFAWDSLVSFAKQVIAENKRIEKGDEDE